MTVNIKRDFGQKREIRPLVYGYAPPQAKEMEEQVLGAILYQKELLETVVDILRTEDCFYEDHHQKIYACMLEANRSGMGFVDSTIIADMLEKKGELEIVGGRPYLIGLMGKIVNTAHIVKHAAIIKEKHMYRELIRVSGQAVSSGYEASEDVFELLARVQGELEKINDIAINSNSVAVGDEAARVVKEIHEKKELDIRFTGVPSGMPMLDDCTSGWQKCDLIILGARPSVGKTAFSLNLAMNAATDATYGVPVAYFSIEMTKTKVTQRLLSAISGIPNNYIVKPHLLQDHELQRLRDAQIELKKTPIYINDTTGLRPYQLKAIGRKMKRNYGIGLIIIDYLQKMKPNVESKNRERDIASISEDLTAIAKELELPVIALAQLNREVSPSQRPELGNLRESGAIEQDADVIGFLYRPDAESAEGEDSKLILTIQKNRNGYLEDIPLQFNKVTQKITQVNATPQPFTPPEPNHNKTMSGAWQRKQEPFNPNDI